MWSRLTTFTQWERKLIFLLTLKTKNYLEEKIKFNLIGLRAKWYHKPWNVIKISYSERSQRNIKFNTNY